MLRKEFYYSATATDLHYILNGGLIVKTKLKRRLAGAQAGRRYMGRSASTCGFGWLKNCHKAKCVRLARMQTAGLIITAELTAQIDATVRLELDSDEARCTVPSR